MSTWPLVLALIGCGGSPASLELPREPPRLHLQGCKRAVPGAPRTDLEVPHGPFQMSTLNGNTIVTVGSAPSGGVQLAPFSAGDVDRAIAPRRAAIDACFGKRGGTAPALVQLSLILGTDRTIIMVSAHSTIGFAAMCAANELLRAKLDVPAGPRSAVSVVARIEVTPGAPPSTARLPWQPFALRETTETGEAGATAVALALRTRADGIAACFRPGAPTGSLRAMIEIDAGKIHSVRVGGLGDAAIEHCVRDAIAGATLTARATGEAACDLSFGDAEPWRATAADYRVVDVTPTEVRDVHAPLPAGASYLVVATPETSGEILARAFAWAADGDVTVLALRDPRGPIYVGAAVNRAIGAMDLGNTLAIEVAHHRVRGCMTEATQTLPIADVERLARLVERTCRATHCAMVELAFDDDATVKEIAEVADAARRAGLDRLVIGGGARCRIQQ